jgi:hypothetical protein
MRGNVGTEEAVGPWREKHEDEIATHYEDDGIKGDQIG